MNQLYQSQNKLCVSESEEGLCQVLQYIQQHWNDNYSLVVLDMNTYCSAYILPTNDNWESEILKLINALCHIEHTWPKSIELDNYHQRYIIKMNLYKGRLQSCATYQCVDGELTIINKPQQEYNAYYDESEHSKKITNSTIHAENFAPYFCAAILCIPKQKDKEFQAQYLAFENKYKAIFTVEKDKELKSQTPFSKKKFKAGLNIHDKQTANFISDYLQLLIDWDLPFTLYCNHKLEFMLRQYNAQWMRYPSIGYVSTETEIVYRSNVYALTKLLQKYHPSHVLDNWEKPSFIPSLSEFLSQQYSKNENIPHKTVENDNILQIISWLNDEEVNVNIDWNYKPIFEAFRLYMQDECLKIRKFDLDKEGTHKTKAAAQTAGFASASEMDSTQSVPIRATDILAGLFNHLINTLENQTQYANSEEYRRMKSLPYHWMPQKPQAFELYKKLYAVLFLQHNSWYKVCSGLYVDSFAILTSLLTEIQQYTTWEEYNAVSKSIHQQQWEQLNAQALQYHWKVHGLE